MSSSLPWYARRARVIRPGALVACAALLAACGGDARPAQSAAAAPPDSAAADTSALAVARRQIGPEVRSAVPFHVRNYHGRFIAAAVPVQQWVDDPLREGVSVAPGGHEILILEMPDTSVTYAFTKPGLYVSDLPGTVRTGPNAPAEPDSSALRQLSGVEDINADGDAEVWAVQYGGPRHPYTWELRVYDRGGRALYQLAAKRRAGGTGIDPASWDASKSLESEPQIRAWMTNKVQALETQFGGAASASAPASAPADTSRTGSGG
ncbi:hypothetical protein [Longimicrobium sp.]|uniref:hypothetical protein n=1 Tax=Longimicrobium sp. TaxID=2029185 RepID=UPI002E365A1B|nr:hypothetical protein [Longimicrobium sp.]HEX6036462.1 hypothetical protein [Longimicrobium sp.]